LPKKKLVGKIVSTKMEKTVVVRVSRKYSHPRYHKVVEAHKKYLAHTEGGYQVGDQVTIVESKPISKRKRWKVVEEGSLKTQISKRKSKNHSSKVKARGNASKAEGSKI
jgi:small subunit ribosomal protein S17